MNEHIAVADDSANIGRRYKSTGSNGAVSDNCRCTSATPLSTAPASTSATTTRSALCAASPMPKINSPKKAAFSSALARSKRCEARGVAGRARNANPNATSPNGTLTANSHCHGATDRMPAATDGPAAVDTPTTSALKPTPRPSERDG